MRNLVLAGVAIAALAGGVANAADLAVPRPAQQTAYVSPPPLLMQQGPRGVAGARWGNLCWVDTDNVHYAGYWAPCPQSVMRATRAQVR
jgi:hypothetical protein